MYTLGINAVYHDSAACLVRDGEEERFQPDQARQADGAVAGGGGAKT